MLFLLMSFFKLSAQEQSTTLPLSALLSGVSEKAPSLIADSSAIAIRKSMANDTKYNWLPNLNLDYQADMGTNNNVSGSYFGFGVVPSNSGGVRTTNLSNAALSNLGVAALDWEIYNFGGYKAQNKVAQSDIKLARDQYKLSKYQLQATAIDKYLQLYNYQNLTRIQKEDITRNQQIRSSIEALAKSGVRAGVDTSIADAELSKSRLILIELTNRYQQVQLQLSALSGIPYQNIIADSLLVKPLLALTQQVAAMSNDILSHPLIGYYQSLYQNSKERENLVKKTYLPKVMVEGAVWGRGSSLSNASDFNPLYQGWGLTRTNYLVGIGLSYNLTNLVKKRLKLNTQISNTIYEENRLTEQKVSLETNNRQSAVELQTALKRLDEIPHQLSASQAAYRQKYSLYKNGLINLIELNIAQELLYRAEADYENAKYEFCHAIFEKAITQNQVEPLLTSLK